MSWTTTQIELSASVVTNHPAAEGNAVSWTPVAEQIGPDILLVHNVIPRLDDLVVIAEKHAGKFNATTVVNKDLKELSDSAIRRCDQIRIGGAACPEGLVFYALLCSSIEGNVIKTYLTHVNPHATVHVGSGYTLLRYREGDYFKEHVDVTRDHPVLGHRRLSTITFCNDDFDGGELVFPRQGITIKPEKGLMVMFPSGFTHPHESTEVTCGTKYSIVSWFF